MPKDEKTCHTCGGQGTYPGTEIECGTCSGQGTVPA